MIFSRKNPDAPDLVSIVFLFGFSISSLYVFPSGLPQPADFVLLIWVLLGMFTGQTLKVDKRYSRVLLFSVLFAAWSVIVSFVNTLIYSDANIAFRSIFIVYNVLIFASLAIQMTRNFERYRKVVLYGAVCATVFSTLGVAVNYSSSLSRLTGWLNNPNQLAYYSLTISSILLITGRPTEIVKPWFLAAFLLNLYLVFLAASLTAMVAVPVILLGFILRVFLELRTALKLRFFGATLALGAVVFIALLDFLADRLLFRFERRISIAEAKIDDIEGRGFDRLLDYPDFIFFGMGEGAIWRFEGAVHEIHNTLLTVLFSYGPIGLLLFLGVLISAIWKRPIYFSACMTAIMIYGITHNGIRFTVFWMFLAVAIAAHAKVIMRNRAFEARGVVHGGG